MTRTAPSLAAIRQNPTLHPLAFSLVAERFPNLKWHSHADSPDSSQAFALSAFVPVLTCADKDAILERFVTRALPLIPPRSDRAWRITPEFTKPELLGETGAGVPTNVDILLEAADAVVCVESKFRVDAREGFGACSQATSHACRGFHGSCSDTRGGSASCRLAVKDGRRQPRKYWELGIGQFRVEALAEQTSSQVCPYRDAYQLMRNYLTACELARRDGKPFFGVIGIVPEANSREVKSGVRLFQNKVLLPENADRVAAFMYEDYIAVLNGGSAEAKEFAKFLTPLL
jgi:hypothetical protein